MSESTGIPQGSPAVGAAGSAPAAPGVGGTECSGAAVGSARIAVKKAQLRSSPRPKKLEKLGVYSSCKVSYVRAGKKKTLFTSTVQSKRLPFICLSDR